LAQFGHNARHLVHIFIAYALAPPIAPVQAVEDMLPNLQSRLKASHPIATALRPPLEAPLTGELIGAQVAPLASSGIRVSPFYFDGHDRRPLRFLASAALQLFNLAAQICYLLYVVPMLALQLLLRHQDVLAFVRIEQFQTQVVGLQVKAKHLA
jgi:hypothetical protein